MLTEPKTSMRMMCYQTANINKDTELVRQSQKEVLEFKSTINEILKKIMEWLKNKFQLAEETINDLENKLIVIIQSK